MEYHEGILFGHVYPHHFLVYAIFKVLVSGLFAVKFLEAVQAEVLSSLTFNIPADRDK